jgi:hypothetical protein
MKKKARISTVASLSAFSVNFAPGPAADASNNQPCGRG